MRKRSRETPGKTLIVLGAGFTRPAGGATQKELLRLITQNGDLPAKLRRFFARVFRAEHPAAISRLTLEDVFTVLDQAFLSQENVRGIAYGEIDEIRKFLIHQLVCILSERVDYSSVPHRRFAEQLVRWRVEAGPEADPFSIFSFNWDILLDKVLHRVCCDSSGEAPARIDYGCSTFALKSPASKQTAHVSSMFAQDSDRLPIKLLKLHGSLNWLVCPQCERLYVTFDETAGPKKYHRCPACRERALLDPLIITPTLLKDLQTIQLRTVWHNALAELQAAGRIIFVGYSFPMADFEFRYLLAKGVPPEAEITVVNRPAASAGAGRFSAREHAESQVEKRSLEERYRAFFGARRVRFLQRDAEEFMMSDLRA